jgi:large subunit ribosomal protein L5
METQGESMSASTTYLPRVRRKYSDAVIPRLPEEFGYKNVNQVPKLEKVVVNMTTKEAIQNVKLLDTAVEELTMITGQRAVLTRARKSIANFKLREGVPIGARVTLRGVRMWEFVDRLISVAIPRIRDFRGISPKAFDGRGNYSLGLTEQIIFPEIDYDKVTRISGMNITFVTTAKTDEEARALLRALGMPFSS